MTVGRAEAPDDVEAWGDLELPPDRLIVLQQVANALEFVPLFVDQVLAFVVDHAQSVDHTRPLVLVDTDLRDAAWRINFKRLLGLILLLSETSAFGSHQWASQSAREAQPHLKQVRCHAQLDAT